MQGWILSLVLLSAIANAQSKPADVSAGTLPQNSCSSADERALRQISEQWKEGYNHGNAAQVAALYTEDAYYLTQHFVAGFVHPRSQIQAYVQRGVDARYHIDTIEVVRLECAGDFAYTVTRYESTNAGQKAFGVNLVVLKRIQGKWLIVAHESAVPDPATAIPTLDPPTTR
ncbi:MAG: DUF4440 domain-containing protein [Acidobacteriia bacterium]|nr:DUF4440 domain-containing protein [Terriglobia bacterium]